MNLYVCFPFISNFGTIVLSLFIVIAICLVVPDASPYHPAKSFPPDAVALSVIIVLELNGP